MLVSVLWAEWHSENSPILEVPDVIPATSTTSPSSRESSGLSLNLRAREREDGGEFPKRNVWMSLLNVSALLFALNRLILL